MAKDVIVPSLPLSITLFAVCAHPHMKESGAHPRYRPFSSASLHMRAAPSVSRAKHFSVYACLPALSILVTISSCTFGVVRLTTISMLSSASSSSMLHALIPYFSATFSALATLRFAIASTLMIPNMVVMLSR